MKKYFNYIISTLLFLSISFNSFSQSSGGALQVFPKDIQKAELKRLSALNGSKLKSGADGAIDCLNKGVCSSSSPIILVKNASWSVNGLGVTWTAKKTTGIDVDGAIVSVDFPVGNLIITKNAFTGVWSFNPSNIPTYQ